MTGMYQTSTGTHPMRSHRDDDFRLPPGVRPLTHRLRDAGYFTANIKTIGGHVVGTGKLDLNFVNEGPIFESDDWSALEVASAVLRADQLARGRIRHLRPQVARASRGSSGSASASTRRSPRPRT